MIGRRTVIGGLAAGLAACRPVRQGASSGLTPVRFVTDWKAEAEHGGYYQALAEGLYRSEGLDVRISPGGPGVNVPQLIASGAADLGVGSDSFIVARLAQAQIPLRAVMAAFQKNPQVLIAHPDPKIRTLADLKGRPTLISTAARDSFWPWLKARYGFTDAQVRTYNFSAAPFLSDPNAVQEGYVTSEPFEIEKALGKPPRVFLLADEGYASYASMVLASERWISTRADVVARFVRATVKGWRSFLDGDGAGARALILKDNPEMSKALFDHARAELKIRGLVEGGDAKTLGVGAMTDARWSAFAGLGMAEGLFPRSLDIRRAYTLQFLAHARL